MAAAVDILKESPNPGHARGTAFFAEREHAHIGGQFIFSAAKTYYGDILTMLRKFLYPAAEEAEVRVGLVDRLGADEKLHRKLVPEHARFDVFAKH